LCLFVNGSVQRFNTNSIFGQQSGGITFILEGKGIRGMFVKDHVNLTFGIFLCKSDRDTALRRSMLRVWRTEVGGLKNKACKKHSMVFLFMLGADRGVVEVEG